MSYETINPTTGQRVATFETFTDARLEEALAKSAEAFAAWRRSALAERARLLTVCAGLLEERATALAEIMAMEMGKPLAEGEAEAKKCAWVCRYYAENGERMLQPVPHKSDGSQAFVQFDPIGPILAIMPWNFPFWQVFRHAAPVLMAGNVILLKHASATPQCAEAIEKVIVDAGFPLGALQALYITTGQAGDVIADPRVAGVTLTGSTPAGRKVAEASGRALKKTVLELGGSDPFIVLADADVDKAATAGVASRCINSGQSCIAAKRFILVKDIADRFLEKFTEGMKQRKVGDPMNRENSIGPMAREDLRDELAQQVAQNVAAGARLHWQGEAPKEGFFFPPTILADVKPGMPAWTEEMFGPVATVIVVEDEDEAIRVANDTPFGLGAALWTGDVSRASELAARIDAGAVFINGLVKSDPRLPFGGVKDSGYGRELAREGVLEFVNQKTVWVG